MVAIDDYLINIIKDKLKASTVIAEGAFRRHRAILEIMDSIPL